MRPQVCRLLKDCDLDEEMAMMEADLKWIRENPGMIFDPNVAALRSGFLVLLW